MRNPFARVAKAEPARPSLRDRAVTLKASAARVMKRQPAADPAAAVDAVPSVSPSPALTAMVAEWERLLRIENSADLTDEEMKPICDARHRVHGEICAFPAASIADLAAKLPLFRDEIVASEPSNPLRPTMDYQSWCGIVRDVEGVAGAQAPKGVPGLHVGLPPTSALKDAIDLTDAKMGTLLTLQQAADMFAGLGNALLCQPRFGDNDDSDDADRSAAFLAVEWLVDACHHLVGAAVQEARKRRPSNENDRAMRLATIAVATIENGDAGDTRAMARALHNYATVLQQ